MPAHLLKLIALIICTLTAYAQDKAPTNSPSALAAESAGRVMSIAYGSPSWNNDSAKIDTAYLIMRDKATGKIVQINLEETEPDSSEFSGNFSVNFGLSDKNLPEIFIPPTNIRTTDKDNRKIYEQIQNNKLPRKPVIWKKNERGQATLDVYDTREQAESALKAYQTQVALAKPLKATSLKPLASEKAAMVAQQMDRQIELNKLAAQAAQHESERIRLEQIEKAKADERLKQARAATEKERAERKARAKALGDEAMELFNQGKFPEAEVKFREAVELDPENKSYYFKYGVTLYRNEKFNEALVILKLAEVDAKIENEKRYFMGLTYYRLKELPAAMGEFDVVAKTTDPIMAPSSEFYRGVVFFVQEKYDDAKNSFDRVIDTSQDPKMDQQAEDYLQSIADAMAVAKLRANKFTFMGTVGAGYDSNILLAPDNVSDQGTPLPTKVSDVRFLTIADLEYRPVYSDKHELFVKGNASLTNSLKDEAAVADPFLYSLAVPYSYKTTLGKKAFKGTIKPGYDTLYMATGGSSTKTATLNSPYVLFDTTFVMNPTWFANYNFEYRMDDSLIASSAGRDNADASKYSLRTNQTFFMDKARKTALIASAGYVVNAAQGADKKYNRIEGSATFARPFKWDTTWNASLSFYKLSYPDETNSRSDFNLTLSTGITKPVKEWLIWGITGSYTKNDSSVTAQEYSKYMVLTTATYLTDF